MGTRFFASVISSSPLTYVLAVVMLKVWNSPKEWKNPVIVVCGGDALMKMSSLHEFVIDFGVAGNGLYITE